MTVNWALFGGSGGYGIPMLHIIDAKSKTQKNVGIGRFKRFRRMVKPAPKTGRLATRVFIDALFLVRVMIQQIPNVTGWGHRRHKRKRVKPHFRREIKVVIRLLSITPDHEESGVHNQIAEIAYECFGFFDHVQSVEVFVKKRKRSLVD